MISPKKLFALAAVLVVLLTVPALAQQALHPEKQRELAAAGITDWAPGQNRGGANHSVLANPIVLPEAASRDTATMQYDDGTISALPTVFGQVFGNRFSQGVSGVALGAMTLNSFSFYFAEDSTPDTNLFFQAADPSTMAGMIAARASLNINGLVNAGSSFTNLTAINVINQTDLGTTGMFSNVLYLGAWCLNANTTVPVDNEAIGLSSLGNRGGPSGRGYTADSGVGTVAATDDPTFNAVLRANVTSAQVVPVELMSFSVDND